MANPVPTLAQNDSDFAQIQHDCPQHLHKKNCRPNFQYVFLASRNGVSNLVKSQNKIKMPTWQHLFSRLLKMGPVLLKFSMIALKVSEDRTANEICDIFFQN